MTKRDLVKWLECKKIEAVDKAAEAREQAIESAEELEYKELGIDVFIDDIYPLIETILNKYEAFVDNNNAKNEGINNTEISKYDHIYGYHNLSDRYGDKKRLRRGLTRITQLETERYDTACSNAREDYKNVVSTYNTVIETVKNLPTYKDGIEYLKKLGFDISEIQPVEKKKQLPATTCVNVDVKYLLLNKEDNGK